MHMISRITHVSVAISSAHSCAALHIQRWRPNGWTDRDPNWYKHSFGQSALVMGVGVRIARAARVQLAIMAAQPSHVSAKRKNEYMNGTLQ
jgi:hypothetical protein